MDIQMPQVSGIDALHLLAAAAVPVPVIILTTFDDNERVLQAMQAGARGYLLKDVALELLVDAIHKSTCRREFSYNLALPTKFWRLSEPKISNFSPRAIGRTGPTLDQRIGNTQITGGRF